MNTPIVYGSAELQQLYHRYWLFGLGISIAVHGLLVALLAWATPATIETRIPPGSGSGSPPRWIPPAIIELFQPGGGGLPASSETSTRKGTPVPVPDALADPEVTFASQEELHRHIAGDSESEGTSGVIGGNASGDASEWLHEEPPPPWVPGIEKEPMLVSKAVPRYPELARLAGMEGRVFVRVWVDKEGRTRTAEILSTTHEIFNEAALEAARRFVFTPAFISTGPVSVWVSVPFTFKLDR